MKLRRWLCALCAVALWPVIASAESVRSPDGRIEVTLDTDGEGVAFYQVARDGEPLIAKSNLGFNFTDADPLRRNLTVADVRRASVDARWQQPWGERQFIDDKHNELAVTLVEHTGVEQTGVEQTGAARRIIVRVRVFDGGIGLRYEFPQQGSLLTARIAEELTEFNLAQDGSAWWIQAGDWNRYEYLTAKTPISAVSMAHTPITMKLANGTYLSLHEAALVDYSGMWLQRLQGTNFRTRLAPSPRGPKVVRQAPFDTPWRSIMIADNPAGLFANDLTLNLNEPNRLGDVSWFTPHKYIGIWWEMHLEKATWASGPKHGATTENARKYIDFAAANGFRGVLIEGWNKGWDGNWFGNGREFSFTEAYPDFDLAAVTDYARGKGVRLIGHHETGGNIKVYEAQLEDAMALYQRIGVDAVKTGYVADAGAMIAADPSGTGNGETFIWHDGQESVRHHLKVVETAARHKIVINPHEPIKDTGLRRTYPNWVSREGARGAEYDAWGVPKNTPDHIPTLVWTRLLAGPMDYTPGIFSLSGRDGTPLASTLARQLAYYVVIYSPIQMVADLPENLARYPDALAFARDVPVDWAQSLLLDGAVGEFAVIARQDRQSDRWFVGAVTDDQARMVTVDLSKILDRTRAYRVTVYADGPTADGLGQDRHAMSVDSYGVRGDDTLTFKLARAGGLAMSITPQD